MDRIATFRTFIAQRPDDPFPRYGLAMELRGQGQLGLAIEAFNELATKWPDYVPTYLMAGTALVESGNAEGARSMFERGIEAARRRSDNHALSELQTALAGLPEADS